MGAHLDLVQPSLAKYPACGARKLACQGGRVYCQNTADIPEGGGYTCLGDCRRGDTNTLEGFCLAESAGGGV